MIPDNWDTGIKTWGQGAVWSVQRKVCKVTLLSFRTWEIEWVEIKLESDKKEWHEAAGFICTCKVAKDNGVERGGRGPTGVKS